MDILIQADLFRNESDIPRTRKCLLWLLEGMVNMNRAYLREYPETPDIYDAGIKYKKDDRPKGPDGKKVERWILIPKVIEKGGSDCKNLVAWRCAELRELHQVKCRPFIRWRNYDGGRITIYHVLVQFPDSDGFYRDDSRCEDPSRLLGMGSEMEGV